MKSRIAKLWLRNPVPDIAHSILPWLGLMQVGVKSNQYIGIVRNRGSDFSLLHK
jgi:hypothetical protein